MQVSLRAWAHLPLAGLRAGNYRLGMHPKPVVRGPKAGWADVLEGFALSIQASRVCVCVCVRARARLPVCVSVCVLGRARARAFVRLSPRVGARARVPFTP